MGMRKKLALLGASAVVVAILAATVVFNLFIGWKVEADAVADIEYALDLNDEVIGTGRTPNYLLLDSSYQVDVSERRWCSPEVVELAAWIAKHPQQGKVSRVTIGDWTCYATVVSADDYYEVEDGSYDEGYRTPGEAGQRADGSRQNYYYLVYIDTTSEQSLVVTVNTAFGIIGLLGALAAALAGHIAGKRIDEAQAAQKRFYENMSHDLKTPLAAIRGYAEGAAGGVMDAEDASRAIVRETDRMTEEINEILRLSRLESGAVQLAKEGIVIEDFVQDCLMPMEGAVRTKGLDVQLDMVAGEVMADPGLFEHALSNVLSNAVRHAETCIRVRFDGARLSVWNDGDVPEPSRLPQLFDRFHAGEGGSTGIGLAIAKEVAVLHGWDVSANVVEGGLEIAFTF